MSIPDEAIVVWGKGLRFVNTTAMNTEHLKIENRRDFNNIISKSKKVEEENNETNELSNSQVDTSPCLSSV